MDLTPATIVAIAATLIVAINLAAFAAFGIDKRLAEAQERRISEATLLELAFFGGTLGAYAGRHVFRHKTRKQPFSNNLFTIASLQVVAIGGAIGWFVGGLVRSAASTHDLNPPARIVTAMFGKYQNVFRSRWKALWWAAGVLMTAYCTVPSPDETGGSATPQAAPTSAHPDNPWALDPPKAAP